MQFSRELSSRSSLTSTSNQGTGTIPPTSCSLLQACLLLLASFVTRSRVVSGSRESNPISIELSSRPLPLNLFSSFCCCCQLPLHSQRYDKKSTRYYCAVTYKAHAYCMAVYYSKRLYLNRRIPAVQKLLNTRAMSFNCRGTQLSILHEKGEIEWKDVKTRLNLLFTTKLLPKATSKIL